MVLGKAFLLHFGASGGALISLKDLGMGMWPQGISLQDNLLSGSQVWGFLYLK